MQHRMSALVALAFATCAVSCVAPGSETGESGAARQQPRIEPPGVTARSSPVCPDGATTLGIDVSYWQGNIDWASVAGDGVEFAFIRVSDGLTYYDTEFQTNWKEAARTGVIRGPYQYFRPGQDAVAQAELLISEVGSLEAGDLPPVIDVETSDGQSTSRVVEAIGEWMDTVESGLGVAPMIYTSASLWSTYTGDSDDFADYPLWVANWEASCPSVPDEWGQWEVWQYSSEGSVSGIGGNVDLNVYNGDLDALRDFGIGDPECGDGACNGDETTVSCPEDCPSCDAIPPEGRVLDEAELCFDAGGTSTYWHTAADGYAGSLLWTHTTDSPDPDNYGVWNLEFDESGRYQLDVYTAAAWAESTRAAYEVQHAGTIGKVVVDQSAVDGWFEVGTFDFSAGADQWVRLEDNTGEPYDEGATQIVFDAVRLTRIGASTDTGDGEPDSGGTNAEDDTGSKGDGGNRAHAQPADEVGGCACGALAPRSASWVIFASVAAFGGLRRRRRGVGVAPGPR